jgi:Flp pilus assembly pilin Flp
LGCRNGDGRYRKEKGMGKNRTMGEDKRMGKELGMRMKRVWQEVRSFWRDEDGVGVIEIVLILVVLIGLVIIFKKQINTLLENIFKQINSKSKEVY